MIDRGVANSPLSIGVHNYIGYVGFEFPLQLTMVLKLSNVSSTTSRTASSFCLLVTGPVLAGHVIIPKELITVRPPNLHLLAELFLNCALRQLFDAVILFHL